MTEEPAPRAPHVPQAPQTPAPSRGEVPGAGRPPQGDTAARIVVHESDACQGNITGWDCEDCEDDACEHECHDTEPTSDLRERLDAALRTVGLARNLAAYRDAVLPVVEEALAEQRKRLRAVPEEHRCESVHPDRDLRCTRASDHVAHVNGGDGWSCACDLTTERAEQAETERAQLAERNRDLDAQLTRERQQRLAAEAEARIAHTDLGKERATIGRLTAELRAVEIDRDQWRDRAHALRAEVSDDPTAATYGGYLQRAEDAEDRLRKAERRVEHFEEHAAQTNADLGIETQRAEQAERQRDQAIAALTHHAAEAHRRKWRHDGDNQAAFDALHRLGDEILASRDRILAALDPDQPKESS